MEFGLKTTTADFRLSTGILELPEVLIVQADGFQALTGYISPRSDLVKPGRERTSVSSCPGRMEQSRRLNRADGFSISRRQVWWMDFVIFG